MITSPSCHPKEGLFYDVDKKKFLKIYQIILKIRKNYKHRIFLEQESVITRVNRKIMQNSMKQLEFPWEKCTALLCIFAFCLPLVISKSFSCKFLFLKGKSFAFLQLFSFPINCGYKSLNAWLPPHNQDENRIFCDPRLSKMVKMCIKRI